MCKIYTSVEELIGKTPLIELSNFRRAYGLQGRILGKVEFYNPAGSVKDRVAKKMLDDAEEKGLINQDSVIIEPTSGNTGIGLALIASARGYQAIIVMPENMSEERKVMMKLYGAKLVLTPAGEGMKGAIAKAKELAKEIPNAFIPDQFGNPANSKAHYETTGPEIYRDTDGGVDAFVAGIGTGGTITGVAQFLKEKNKDIFIAGAEPAGSPFLTEGKSGAHGIQGIGAGFCPEVLKKDLVDKVFPIKDEDAYSCARDLCRLEGLLVGISSGAALRAAVELAKQENMKDKTIVVLLPDTGMRYLSTPMAELN
ncbi:MAG: cysteine synthase A [Lachnospiraceae bacterium]|nr:cysteine synthase A [Lachnospiraceae bacterium]